FVENFANTPNLMHTIYALEGVESNKEVTIRELSGIEKFKSLRDAKEMNLFFHELTQLNYLVKITKGVSVFKVTVPWDLKRLKEVYHSILEHQKSFKEEKQ
ncbi:MAG: hypothetical protein KAI79_15720, partial [Bacteroidales bacterium]|nr:hypothetical protein [Bacteroidales bacterium]